MRYIFLEWVNDFEIMMLNALAEDYPVLQINRIMRRYKSINKILPGQALKQWHKKWHCAIKLSAVQKDDVVICNGYSVFPFLDYVATLPCKKILILRDDVEALTRKRRKLGQLAANQQYIDTVRTVFDVIFSFDPADCQKYNLRLINQFLPFSWQQIQQRQNQQVKEENRCFFVGGYEPVRAEVIRQLTPVIEATGCSTDFYLLDKYHHQDDYPLNCKNEKLSYQQNIDKMSQSRFLLEINKPEQQGLSLRALEALVFNKKLITNNPSIADTEIYDPSRVFIYTGNNTEDLAAFMHSPAIKAEPQMMKRCCADAMIDTLAHAL